MRVEFLPAAIADIREIALTLEALNPAAADRFLDRLDAVIDRLQRYPRHGRRFEAGHSEFRQVNLGRY